MKIELLLCPMNLFIMGPIIPADLKQEAEDVSVKIEPTQEIEIEPNNQSDPQVKMEPDIDPLEINQINSVHGDLQSNCDKTKYNLKRHIDSVHVDTQCCDQCDYKTGLQRNLKIHIDSVGAISSDWYRGTFGRGFCKTKCFIKIFMLKSLLLYVET